MKLSGPTPEPRHNCFCDAEMFKHLLQHQKSEDRTTLSPALQDLLKHEKFSTVHTRTKEDIKRQTANINRSSSHHCSLFPCVALVVCFISIHHAQFILCAVIREENKKLLDLARKELESGKMNVSKRNKHVVRPGRKRRTNQRRPGRVSSSRARHEH